LAQKEEVEAEDKKKPSKPTEKKSKSVDVSVLTFFSTLIDSDLPGSFQFLRTLQKSLPHPPYR
jgi:hypothetical protein